ncbi:CxxC motif-containing protein [Clostridium tetanomorphum]|uniref:DUF1667 domain-containing protein n=1 Tax=Clostridium tetanomorphum TaxID=1553 RepID=A0A923EC06_CLOTT|nr:DUF1667 domain-containing protein [Clostridium tetanomorphum]KAJ53434.1 hypothetical protein CTM_02254 [Clostridium tetanomorphum DSM 665]MBC2398491.1 DUF1667 domain-containing protein [Clostridium tetanomorphum]MBP1865337.1 CxxC motif-containing protein [Clostridium tetanomorphum]NRS85260.1 CxxC motif-containing protein [Clostridium tetanomorphum]NRZ98437.1 CxxC motif-containing protein [Clostridium tetanomorphum]
MNVRELVCIGCPMGCNLQVELNGMEVKKVQGNVCARGKIYAEKECTNPTRIVTSSIKVENGEVDMVSVKTEKDIPKDKIFECVQAIRRLKVKAPVNIGEVVIENFADTGVNVIVTKKVKSIN